ncbi:MAG TPA: hypothetical protein VHE34_09065 [Puia sp.]|uniref:hypothetical protein n=1 Tax=Puia sp. TaxID=2045100 RepID=UPI002BDAFA9E|nr:hypothetical protein [Puia sp.]HVU95362.1 hypothetical protein [Puia sp.]
MRRTKLLLGVLLLFLHPFVSAQAVITLLQPAPFQTVGDSVMIRVSVRSDYLTNSVTGVIADPGNRAIYLETALVYDAGSASWSGSFNLKGIPDDTLTLLVNTRDAQHFLRDQIQTRIVHDSVLKTTPAQAPQLVISSPLPWSTARPVVRLTAKANAMTDSCQLILRATAQSTVVMGAFLDSIQTDLDLSSFEGSEVLLTVQAIDKDHQTTTSPPMPVFVESSPNLQEYFVAPRRIVNFNFNRLLIVDDSAVSNPRIIDLADSSIVPIPYPGYVDTGYITSQGAVFSAIPGNGLTPDSLFDLNYGVLYPLGPVDRGTAKVAGNNLIWVKPPSDGNSSTDSLFLRDLATRSITYIARNVLAGSRSSIDVAANGTVVYADSTQNIIKYFNGTYTAVTNITRVPTQSAGNPLTDGNTIIYLFRNETINQAMLVGPTGNATLTGGLRGSVPGPYSDYQLNNNYFAYIDIPIAGIPPDSPLHREVVLMDPALVPVPVMRDAFSNRDGLDLLGPNGQLMFFHAVGFDPPVREWTFMRGPVKQIASSLGKTYYYDSGWYVAIGRTLFRVDLNAPPDRIKNSTLLIPKDSTHTLTAADFTANFSGPGQLIRVKITGLPANGILKKAGIPVNTNDEIIRADLGLLTYTPENALVTNDTLQWNASDGITYTAADAQLSLRMIGKPIRPQPAGLKDAYCTNASAPTVTIINYPGNADGTTIQVLLDNSPIGSPGMDTVYSFDPASLSPGDHTLIVIFVNVAGSSSDTVGFRVLQPVTPVVSLSANLATVNDPAVALTLTATNTGGGGTAPLYTFARDRAFSNVLQKESSENTYVPDPRTLSFGDNRFYARMRTSDSCYTIETGVDSIDIRREAAVGLTDADDPGHIIGVAPNPFTGQFAVEGLSNKKRYSLTLYRGSGDVLITVPVINRSFITLQLPQEAPGIYFLKVYDATRGKLLGTIRLLKE